MSLAVEEKVKGMMTLHVSDFFQLRNLQKKSFVTFFLFKSKTYS